MSGTKTLFDSRWDVDKYKSNYDSEHWGLCRAFMETHKTKYPEQKLVHLTEAFYQMGVYGSSYDPKTTRMVNALTVEVLDDVLRSHPGVLYHPFNKSAIVVPELSIGAGSQSSKNDQEPNQSSSIWDVQVDQSIIANVLMESQMKELFKGFVIIYDIRKASTMIDNKVTILEDSFKRSKYGPCHWAKDDTHNNICPIRMALKWRNIVLAEAVGGDEKSLKTRLAQAVLSKMADFSSGIEAKWSYYRDGRLPDRFDNPNPKKSHIYRVLRRSQFRDMTEITSFIDTFANSDSFAEVAFSMDFSNQEKKQLMEYIDKNWITKLTYRTLSKIGVKNKSESYVFVYHIRSGEELRRWLEQTDGENDRYRMVPPGKHRRAGTCDSNVREVLTADSGEKPKEIQTPLDSAPPLPSDTSVIKATEKREDIVIREKATEEQVNVTTNENKEKYTSKIEKVKDTSKMEKDLSKTPQDGEDDLEKLLDGFVLFYDANKSSEIDKDDWFSALCESFKLSKFGPLEVITENVRPLRTRCIFKWNEKTLASAEGLTETQAKTAATLQLISKLEPFTYIIQAKEEYFCGGKVPPFIEDPAQNQSDFCRIVSRKELPSYYTIFQTLDEFGRSQSHGEIIFGPDFTWELKNEISVYLQAKGLGHRYFTTDDQHPWTHMAVYRSVKPEDLKEYLLKNGGENEKYKLIPPPKAEPISYKSSEESKVKSSKEAEKPPAPPVAKKPPAKVVEKRKQQEAEPPPEPLLEEIDSNKIQIKLKKFKVDKVDYPEDTGGDFPGLIIWIGIRKNSVWQKSLFAILLESFKLSKFGELLIEESDESVWGRKEPLKKCVIKATRKVLAVGLGESKTEAKNSASLQVLRQLRKHCYTIQAKESYFKEGKATPYDFNPDPAKAHVYKVMKRNKFKDRGAMINYVNEFARNSCPEEVIFGDDFTYDEREHILDHCRKINLSYRLIKCQSVTKNMHTHIAIFHQLPPPVIKAELMKTGGESDMYRLVPPGGVITNQHNQAYKENTEDIKRRLLKCGGESKRYRLIPPGSMENERDLWPDTLENEKDVSPSEKDQPIRNLPVKQTSSSQPNAREPEQPKPPQPSPTMDQTNSNRIPSLINRVAIENKGKENNSIVPTAIVNSKSEGKNVSVNKFEGNNKNASIRTNNQEGNTATGMPTNELYGVKPQTSQQTEVQLYTNQMLGPQPVFNQPMGPQPQFAEVPYQEVPFGPQPLYVPPPPIYGQPFMDTPLQFGPNPPVYIQQPPCDMGHVMDVGMPSMVPQVEVMNQPINNPALAANQNLPTVTKTIKNSPPKTDLRQELAEKKRQANQRKTLPFDNNQHSELLKSSPDRLVFDVTTERRIINTEESESDGWSRKVFVAEPGGAVNEEDQMIDAESKANFQDLREKLRHKDPARETGPGERLPRTNPPQKNFQNRLRTRSPEQISNKFNRGPNQRISPHSSQQRMSTNRNRSRDISRERWRSRDRSPEQRIIRQRDISHERRVFHDPSRSIGDDRNRIISRRFRSRSRSLSPRRLERSPSPTALYRDLWDNIPARYSQSIFMYKYVKQDSTTETDPYALLRATRSLSFNVDFDFIKEQTAIDEWYVSVELITDDANIHPLVGEGMARTEREASRRAANHAVDTVQKACRVIEPNYRYFCEGGVPDFIVRKSPMKTSVYEIIQNMDPGTPLARYTVEMMFKMFMSSDLEDIYFLATDFSYMERVLVVEMANKMNLWWRLFGPRHPSARPDDVVSTQHVCVFKQKSALQLIRELLAKGGSTEKYTLVDPREYRLTRPRFSGEFDRHQR